MTCPFCKEMIEDDSYYCDQCGKEIMICEACGKPGKGKRCIFDGKKMMPAKSVGDTKTEVTPTPAPAQQMPPAAQPTPSPAPKTQEPVSQPNAKQPAATVRQAQDAPATAPSVSQIPELRLINQNLNVNIEIKDGHIIGRSTGDFVQIFSQFNQISGRHAQFKYDPKLGWTVIDLGSTNGVTYSNVKIVPNFPQMINGNSHIQLANIEFFVQIKNAQQAAPTGTVRV